LLVREKYGIQSWVPCKIDRVKLQVDTIGLLG
jgi:hypothetical protein